MSKETSATTSFVRFHVANPAVYRRMVSEARDWKSAGHEILGMQALLERIRWVFGVETPDVEFKINNDYAAFYARLIMAQEADLEGLFTTRVAPEADAWIERRYGKAAA